MALTDNIIFYAKLNETSGTPMDSVASLTGATFGSVTQGSAGKIGTSYSFNSGTTDYVEFGSAGNLTSIQTSGSVSCWIYPTRVTGTEQIFISKQRWYDDINGFNIQINTTGTISAYLANGSTEKGYTLSNSVVAVNNWYHIVFTWNGATTTGYVNNVKRTGNPVSQVVSPIMNAYKLTVGRDNSPNYYFQGKIDEIGIWDREITAAEVSSLYNSSSGFTYPFLNGSLVKWYDGGSWVLKPVKVWDGGAWVLKPVKRYDGSIWITI